MTTKQFFYAAVLFLITGLLLISVTLFGSRLVTAASPSQTNEPSPDKKLVASGFAQPLAIVNTGVPGDNRLFVVERGGTIRIVDEGGSVLSTPFLDISTNTTTGASERGLLGLAFDPEYSNNGYFYINYSYGGGPTGGADLSEGDTVVARYTVSEDPNVADPNTFFDILTVQQESWNHNGGHLLFGPDGYLYIGLGDGGGSGDPNDRGQDPNTLLGTMLRIIPGGSGLGPDCGRGNYAVPETNPLLFRDDTCDEVWSYGWRNPWRYAFDRQTNDLYVGDVGQNSFEEISRQPADSTGGENYGWNCYEGFSRFSNDESCNDPTQFVAPMFDYGRGDGVSVTGGNVYRGSTYPNLNGYYIFGDFGSGNWWRTNVDGGFDTVKMESAGIRISSFGEDVDGELYMSHYSGDIYQVIDAYGFELGVRGPRVAEIGQATPFSIDVTHVGTESAFDLILTFEIPAGLTYVSGGTLDGNTVTFEIDQLDAGETESVEIVLRADSGGQFDFGSLNLDSDEFRSLTANSSFATTFTALDLKIYLPLISSSN